MQFTLDLQANAVQSPPEAQKPAPIQLAAQAPAPVLAGDGILAPTALVLHNHAADCAPQ